MHLCLSMSCSSISYNCTGVYMDNGHAAPARLCLHACMLLLPPHTHTHHTHTHTHTHAHPPTCFVNVILTNYLQEIKGTFNHMSLPDYLRS